MWKHESRFYIGFCRVGALNCKYSQRPHQRHDVTNIPWCTNEILFTIEHLVVMNIILRNVFRSWFMARNRIISSNPSILIYFDDKCLLLILEGADIMAGKQVGTKQAIRKNSWLLRCDKLRRKNSYWVVCFCVGLFMWGDSKF